MNFFPELFFAAVGGGALFSLLTFVGLSRRCGHLQSRLIHCNDEIDRLNQLRQQLEDRCLEEQRRGQQQGESFVKLQIDYSCLEERLKQFQEQREILEMNQQKQAQALEEKQAQIAAQDKELAQTHTELQKERQHHTERLKELETARKGMTAEFENLATRILEEKSKNFGETNKNALENLLKPFGDKLSTFQKEVKETYHSESQDRTRLRTQIEELTKFNERRDGETLSLVKALKGQNQVQGAWGEMILEGILEKSGLEKGREYSAQRSIPTEEGKRSCPDIIVHLPDQRDVVIDSKVTLTAYERYQNSEDQRVREQALREHIGALQRHVRELSGKGYESLQALRSLDFVLLFVPIEGAYSLAVQQQPDLMQGAFERNVIIVTPSTLLSALRMIESIWRCERQNQNALEIARRAGALYDKFVGFIEDLQEVRKHISRATRTSDDALNKLSSGKGNLVGRVEALKELGAKAKKSLDSELLEESKNNGPSSPDESNVLENLENKAS